MATRPLDANYRPARTFRVGDEIKPVGQAWRRITDIVDHPHARMLILDGVDEFWADWTHRMDHRRMSPPE